MLLIFATLTTYVYSVIAKYYLWKIVSQDKIGKSLISKRFSRKNLIPFSSFFSDYLVKKDFYRKINRLGELLGITISFFINLLYILQIERFSPSSYLTIVILNICLLVFLYLGIYDLLYYEVPAVIIIRLLLFLIAINISVAVSNLFFENSIFKDVFFGRISNLLGLFIGYVSTLALVKFSQESAMGEGDADFNAVTGLMLGFPGVIIYIFVTLVLGSVIGLVFAAYRKQFHGLLLPFFPVMILGFVVTVIYGEYLRKLLFPYLAIISI